jgi:hypothetical protein
MVPNTIVPGTGNTTKNVTKAGYSIFGNGILTFPNV